MALAMLCASHSPLMGTVAAPPDIERDAASGFRALADRVTAFAPDYVIQFSPDHFNGFFYDLMPSFCLGLEASSIGDWNTRAGSLKVPGDAAASLLTAIREHEVDIALSHRMPVDHGFVQIWEMMFGRFDALPIVPIFVNCAAPPLPSYRRARRLGEAVGAFAARSGQRVLIACSGGLSHDPPVPRLETATPEVRERLIAGRNPGAAARQARVQAISAAGIAAGLGEGPCLPLNPDWDRRFIDIMQRGDLDALERLSTPDVIREAGAGGPETLTWMAAAAAMSAAGPYRAELVYYQPIHCWIAGMTMMFAETTSN